MAFLAAAAPYIAMAGAVVQAEGQRQQGKAARANAEAVAIQQDRNAKASEAESQRAAIEERKRAQYLESRTTALAASSGASASDPTVQNILGDIREEGEYRALSALYSGSSDAQVARAQSAASRNEGRAAQRAGRLNAASTILSGASSFYGKYGSAPKVAPRHYSAANSRYSNMGDYVVPQSGIA